MSCVSFHFLADGNPLVAAVAAAAAAGRHCWKGATPHICHTWCQISRSAACVSAGAGKLGGGYWSCGSGWSWNGCELFVYLFILFNRLVKTAVLCRKNFQKARTKLLCQCFQCSPYCPYCLVWMTFYPLYQESQTLWPATWKDDRKSMCHRAENDFSDFPVTRASSAQRRCLSGFNLILCKTF